MTEYERGRKDLADEIIEHLDVGIKYCEECYYDEDKFAKTDLLIEVKQYIQELIKE